MQLRHPATMAFVLALSVATFRPPSCIALGPPAAPGQGADFASRMEDLLAATKQTSYQHTTLIDHERGIVRCDCSGLIGYMLRQQFPEAYVSLRGHEARWRARPLAVTYYETFVAAGQNADGCNEWCRVAKLSDVVPGDIIAWRKPMIRQGATTGHVLMVAGRPQKIGTGMFRVEIIDSTRSAERRGFGAGLKTFTVNEAGEPTGFFAGQKHVLAFIAAGRIAACSSHVACRDDAAFIGKTVTEAAEYAKSKGLQWRVIREDSVPKPVGWKIDPSRRNFVVENKRVVRVVRG